ncbi:MAG: hypothetical protein PHG48_07560 [Eubacteriales bacterium]|nr:hypothetical protein [Eubacteriales bacterium]
MPNLKYYKKIILGATISGIAAALSYSSRGDVLIIESSMLLGSEFIDSMNIKSCDLSLRNNISETACYFLSDLEKRGLIDDSGRLHVFPVSGVLASYIRQSCINILLMTAVVSVKPSGEGFVITIYNADGFSDVHTSMILDTTSEGCLPENQYGLCCSQDFVNYSSCRNSINYSKSLCAMLYSQPGDTLDICGYIDDEAAVMEGKYHDAAKYGGEYVLKVNVGCGAEWPEARHKLHDYWRRKSPDVFAGWKIASAASSFSYDYENRFSVSACNGKLVWEPSASHKDLLSAYDGGAKCSFIR